MTGFQPFDTFQLNRNRIGQRPLPPARGPLTGAAVRPSVPTHGLCSTAVRPHVSGMVSARIVKVQLLWLFQTNEAKGKYVHFVILQTLFSSRLALEGEREKSLLR